MCSISSTIFFFLQADRYRPLLPLPFELTYLRYGLSPFEFEPIYKQIIGDGIPDFSRFDVVDYIRGCVEIDHIDVIEVSMDAAYALPGSLTPQTIEKLVDLKDELGHSYTTHLPLWSIELSSFNEPVRKGSVKSIVETMKLVEPLDPEVYVLHATGSLASEFSSLNYEKSMLSMICMLMSGFSAQSVEEIITQTEINPRKIAIENFEFPFDITREVVDEYDTSICFDTGHVLAKYSGDESLTDFYKTHKDRIVEIHLHDGSYKEINGIPVPTDHIALGHGEMPIREFLMELVKDDFKGPIIFELTHDETNESLERIKKVVPEALSS